MAVGGYNQNVKIAQDLDLYFRLLTRSNIATIDEVLHSHTFSYDGTTLSKNKKSIISAIKIRLKYLQFKDLLYLRLWFGLTRDVILLCLPSRLLLAIRTRRPSLI